MRQLFIGLLLLFFHTTLFSQTRFDVVSQTVKSQKQYGVLLETGEFLIPPKYQALIPIVNGFLAKSNGRWGMLDKKGNAIIAFLYDSTGNGFGEGLLAVKRNNKWGYINSTGQQVIGFKYDCAKKFAGGDALVKKDDSTYWMNVKEQWIETCLYKDDDCCAEKIGPCITQNRIASFNFVGKDCDAGFSSFRKGERYGMIGPGGDTIIPAKYNGFACCNRGIIVFRAFDGKWGFFSDKGKMIKPAEYDDIGWVAGGMVALQQKGKWMVYDINGKSIFKEKLDDVPYWLTDNEMMSVCVKGKYGLYRKDGTEILKPM